MSKYSEISNQILEREFYLQDTLTVARSLLGCRLLVKNGVDAELETIAEGIIIETEAYLGRADKACHSYKGNPAGRTNVMFGAGGHAYIYMIYGLHYCFNVVTRCAGEPEAVLVRALAPPGGSDPRLYSGPGKLCKSLGITKDDYGCDLTAETPSRIKILKPRGEQIVPSVVQTPRIGVAYSGEAAGYPYRFADINFSRSLSGTRNMSLQ